MEGLSTQSLHNPLYYNGQRYSNLFAVVCRFLVHRYSVLQHNAEANGIDGLDEPLDTNVGGQPKISFHEDSDEVWKHG